MTKTRIRDSERMLILLDMLRGRYDHPSAQECFLEMSKKVPGVGRSTVYRHLAKLTEEGLIQEFHVDDGPARFDARTSEHAHFHCTKCGSVMDVKDFKLNGRWPGRAKKIHLIIEGLCESCLNN